MKLASGVDAARKSVGSVLLMVPLGGLTACGGEVDDVPLAGGVELREAEQSLDLHAAAASCRSELLNPIAATASSVEAAGLEAERAIDGDLTTRWSSGFSDPQWLTVDLGSLQFIDAVSLSWETASSAIYEIQVSTDGTLWTTVHHQVGGPVGPLQITFEGLDATARYLRIASERRTTIWGTSLFEVRVTGDPNPECSASTFHVDSVHSKKSIDVAEISHAGGANVHTWDYVDGDNQKWTFLPKGGDEYVLRAVHSGKCLDVAWGSLQAGANLQQYDCHGGSAQRFRVVEVDEGIVEIRNVQSDMCADVAAWSTENGANLIQWPCHGGANQRWRLVSVDDQPSGRRPWAMRDANGDQAWNYSTTLSSGGSEITGSAQYGDVQASEDRLVFPFFHNGMGYAEGAITSAYSSEGIEPTSEQERDAGKPIQRPGALSYFYSSSPKWPYRIKLRDSWGNEGSSVLGPDYHHHCSSIECDVDIPLSDLDGAGLDWESIQAVVVFVDATVPAGQYYPILRQIVFTTPDDAIDFQTDPLHCGEMDNDCRGGPCRGGVCQAALLINDIACGSWMTADEEHIYVADREFPTGGGQHIFRYDSEGMGREILIADTGFVLSMVRGDGDLFYSGTSIDGSTGGLKRFTDGASSSELLFSGSVSQVQLGGDTLVAYSAPTQEFVAGPKGGVEGQFHVLADVQNTYPMNSAVTSTHVYFLTGTVSGTALYSVDFATGTTNVVDTGDGFYGIWAYDQAVYYSYRTQDVSGIRKVTVGSDPVEVVPPVSGSRGYGNPFVDESGIYHSYYDGIDNGFYRTAHGNPSDQVLVTTSMYPYQAPVEFTEDAILFMQTCSRGGPGNVQRIRKP